MSLNNCQTADVISKVPRIPSLEDVQRLLATPKGRFNAGPKDYGWNLDAFPTHQIKDELLSRVGVSIGVDDVIDLLEDAVHKLPLCDGEAVRRDCPAHGQNLDYLHRKVLNAIDTLRDVVEQFKPVEE